MKSYLIRFFLFELFIFERTWKILLLKKLWMEKEKKI